MTRFAVLLLLIGAAASCQSIIDLGDEPTLVPGCGLTRSPGPVCGSCIESRCCKESVACAAEPDCKRRVETCVYRCFDLDCFSPCIEGAGQVFQNYFTCASQCANECAPKEACGTLATCCAAQTDETLLVGCAKNARSENQALCQSSLEQLMCATGSAGAAGTPNE